MAITHPGLTFCIPVLNVGAEHKLRGFQCGQLGKLTCHSHYLCMSLHKGEFSFCTYVMELLLMGWLKRLYVSSDFCQQRTARVKRCSQCRALTSLTANHPIWSHVASLKVVYLTLLT